MTVLQPSKSEARWWTRSVVRLAVLGLDGANWTRGGTWTHHLGSDARIGSVSMGGSGFKAVFEYVTLTGVRR